MPVDRQLNTTAPVGVRDLRKTFASPPPPQLQHSALYRSLPESQLHEGGNDSTVNITVRDTSHLSRLPPRLARQKMKVTSRPGTAPLTSTHAKNEFLAATTYMLEQHKAVELYREEQHRERKELASQREAKWAQMRLHLREMEQKTTSESVKKRRMRIAKQVAAQQLKEQHDRERELLGYEERKHRTSVEGAERRQRHALAVSLWRGVQNITLEMNLEYLQEVEDRDRTDWLEHFFSELEQKHRQAIVRIFSLTKTTIMASEKAARITLQKHLAALAAWKNQQDAEMNSFLGSERKVRQKLYDEEAFGFLEIDGDKRALQQEQARIARRKQEMLLAARREHERVQANARSQIEKDEGDMRQATRTENDALRAVMKQDYVTEKREAEVRIAKRLQREKEEWDRECMRQLMPIMEEEEEVRVVLGEDEQSDWNELISMKKQEWEEILIPVSINHPGPPKEVTYQFNGNHVQLFPSLTFRRKTDVRHYPSGPITNASLTLMCLENAQLGDAIDVWAADVASLKEKKTAAMAAAVPTGLRCIDSTIFDDDNTALCTVQPGDVHNVDDIESTEVLAETVGRMEEQMETELPVVKIVFNAIDKDGITKYLDRVSQALVFKADPSCMSFEPRKIMLQFKFTCAAVGVKVPKKEPKPSGATPRRGGPGARGTGAELFKKEKEVIPTQDFMVTYTVRVNPTMPPVYFINALRPSTRFFHTTVQFDIRKRADGAKMFVPLFPTAAVDEVTPVAIDDFRGTTLRLKYSEGFVQDDAFQFAPSENFTIKKDEIKGPGGVPVAKVTGKILPAANASGKDITVTILDSNPLSAELFEKMLRRFHWSTLNASPANHRRVVEMTISVPPGVTNRGGEVATMPLVVVLKSEVLVSGTINENATVQIEDANTLVSFCDPRILTPKQLWSKLHPKHIPLCLTPTFEAHGNLATRDLITAGSIRVSVVQNPYAWDHIGLNAATNNIGTLTTIENDTKVQWSAQVHAEPSIMATVGKIKRFTHLEGKLRPGFQIDLMDARVNALHAIIKSLSFSTESISTSPVTKLVQIEVFLPDSQARKAKNVAPVIPVRANVNVEVKPSIVRTSQNSLIIPRVPDPVGLGCFSVENASSVYLDGGSMTIEFVEGNSGLEQLEFMHRPLPLEDSSPAARALEATARAVEFENSMSMTPKPRRSGHQSPHFGTPTPSDQDDDDDLIPVAEKGTKPPVSQLLPFSTKQQGRDLLLVRGEAPVGTINEQGMGQPVKINFFGKMRAESRNDPSIPPIINGEVANQIVSWLAYQHSESDSELQKTLQITLTDSFGTTSVSTVVLDVTPIHMPSELANPPEVVYYRSGSRALNMDGVLPFLTECIIEDEDTEFCGQGLMSIQPFVGVSPKDQLVLLQHQTNDTKQKKLVFHEHPVDSHKTSIHADGKEFAVCVNELDEDTGGNRLKFNIRNGTPLDLCTLLMHRIGYRYADEFPTRGSVRQFLFRFNAGDEDVPDTRLVTDIHVNLPLLYTLPIYMAINVRPKHDTTEIFPKLMIGIPPTTSVADNILSFQLTKSDTDDSLSLELSEDLYMEKDRLVASEALARTFGSSQRVTPTPGYSGVLVGKMRIGDGEDTITINFDASTIAGAAAVQAIAARVLFHNNSLAQKAPTRSVIAELTRQSPHEVGFVRCEIDVEAEDQMTEINLERAIVSCYEGETVPIASGAQVIDEDTDFFENDATLCVEVQNGISNQDFVSLQSDEGNVEIRNEEEVFVDGTKVAMVDIKSTARKLLLQFSHCPLDNLQRILRSVVYCGRHCGGRSKLLQIFLRSSASAPITSTNVQISLLARSFSVTNRDIVEHVHNAPAPTPCLKGIRLDPQVSFTGSVMTFTPSEVPKTHVSVDKSGANIAGGRILMAGDRVTLLPLPEHLTLGLKGIMSRGGQQVCSIGTGDTPGSLRLSFPSSSRSATAVNVSDILACVAYEYKEGDTSMLGGDLGKSTDELKRSRSKSINSKEASAASPTKTGKGMEKGKIGVTLKVTTTVGGAEGEEVSMKESFVVNVV